MTYAQSKSLMFADCHATAKRESRMFGISYKRAFANALSGAWKVRKGARGVDVAPGKVQWA